GGSDSKVTTPEFTLNGEAKLTFRAAAWNDGSGTTLKVSASNGSLANSEFTMPAGAWGDFSTTIKGNGKMKLTFQGELRYFLDQVFVTDPGTTGIENVEMNNQPAVTGVYSIDGRYLGNDVSKLGKGLYIVNGKKIVK
ncbi:MAG: peptidase, partial [Prevotella sp.]|nr:peptidase [Prevotella sp.]